MSEAARAGQKGIDSSFGVGGHGSSSWEKWEQFGDAAFSFATKAVPCLSLHRRGHLTIFIQWLQETFLQQPTWIPLMKENALVICPTSRHSSPHLFPSILSEEQFCYPFGVFFRIFVCHH